MDGWDDQLRRSLYGSVAAEINQHPLVLSLDDLTGHRGSADKILKTSKNALQKMELSDAKNFIALTTNDPSMMRSFHRKFQHEFFWILVKFLILLIL